MCRHLGYLGPPRSLASLLFEPPHSLEHQSWSPRHQTEVTMNPDGWGVGWWAPDRRPEPARYRTATPMWADQAFRSPAELVVAPAMLAAARAATPGSAVVETGNAPFVDGPWMLSLNGYVANPGGAVAERLRREVSPARAERLEGTSDSEVLLALLLDRVAAGTDVTDAAAELVADVRAGSAAKLNLLLGDGHRLIATTCGNSLFSLVGSGLADDGVVLASEPLDDHPAWTPIADGALVVATHTTLDISPLP